MEKIKIFISITTIFLFNINLYSQELKTIEFKNQKITDILYILGEEANVTIISDETVQGNTSFLLNKKNHIENIEIFLKANNLYGTWQDNTLYVSKILIEMKENLISIECYETELKIIIDKISKIIGKTILYDKLPDEKISLSNKKIEVKKLFKIILSKYENFYLEEEESFYYIKQIKSENEKYQSISKKDELYSLNIQNERTENLLKKLFDLEKKEFIFLFENDSEIKNLKLKDKTFIEILNLILKTSKLDFFVKEEIYFIINIEQNIAEEELKSLEIIKLNYIDFEEFINLLPKDFPKASIYSNSIKDKLILIGSKREKELIKNYLKNIDTEDEKTIIKSIELKYISGEEILKLIPQDFYKEIISVKDKIILIKLKKIKEKSLNEIINLYDTKKINFPIKLKYIQNEELLENLPPSIKKENLIDSGYPNLIFFTGNENERDLFLEELKFIDKAKPQIKYQILIIQYKKNKIKNYKQDFKFLQNKQDESTFFSGELSNILSLNFDIISNFGYEFALNLNSQLNENKAKIYTDTCLTGLSGKEIKFQNTDTYRYIEYETNEDSNSQKNSFTQTITSGLILTIKGWISGDNMITMDVYASVSKQNSDSSGNGSNLITLPSTSERVVNTQIRTKSGKAIIINGLIKEDINESENFPLGKIPLLSKLFKQKSFSNEKSEIAIYIIPHLTKQENEKEKTQTRIEKYFYKFIKGEK